MMTKESVLHISAPKLSGSKLLIDYSHNEHHFQRGVGFPDAVNLEKYQDDTLFQKLARYIAVSDSIYTFGLDYYDTIVVEFPFSQDEIEFFEKTMFYGLAEFRYVNDIDMRKQVRIVSTASEQKQTVRNEDGKIKTSQDAFVLNGGGKDGVVAIDIATHIGLTIELFSSGDASSRRDIAQESGLSSVLVDRITDGYVKSHAKYKGHKPMSLYVAFVSARAAYLYEKSYVISANEYSASFANLEKDGVEVNHQYTKSADFERQLTDFMLHQGLPVKYFSITRQLYELQVLKIFAEQNESYHNVFLSCNEGMEEGVWCKKCPKCAFVIGAMYLFNPTSSRRVWGEPEQVFDEVLTGQVVELVNPDIKPLECIGTTGENRFLVRQLLEGKIITLTQNQRNIYESYISGGHDTFGEDDLANLHGQNNAPPELGKKIDDVIKRLLLT
jgi:hypothetical protein